MGSHSPSLGASQGGSSERRWIKRPDPFLEGFFDPKRWMAARMGKAGDKTKSESKSAASRANGKLGA
jgi:hypothetical protein